MTDTHNELKTRIDQAWENRELLHDEAIDRPSAR